ncbi:uncharacterized protein LOC128870282 [Anastrepha ludens]|uniref:uncharacterized protein LOC128870282 n=1 Tax=Anastrepha ludens TaxID=28586 RepID=UPI0023B086F4|nr:uncharacterized protein LOC128870282 [Anastrepha ludens]
MSLEEVKQQRLLTRKNMSRIRTIVETSESKTGKILSPIELKCRLGILDSYFKQGLGYQTQIEKLDPEDNGRGDLEDLYVTIRSNIQMQLGEDEHNSTIPESSAAIPVSHSKIPALKLPVFCGRYSEYKNFIASFMHVIENESSLSNIEKFNHLLNCLKGQALETVKAFQITSENYSKALDRLKSRYDNSTLIFMETIKSLFELPSAAKGGASQLQSLVDNVSALYSSLLSIGSDKNISHLLLIHLVMDKVDEETQKKWKESLDFTSLPSWEQCAKVLERRCQFLESASGSLSFGDSGKSSYKQENRNKPPRKGYSFSCTNRSCALCSNSDHLIGSCSRFKQLEIADRFKEVKRLGLCLNCLSNKHQLAHCSSAFRCKHCARSHHSLLHRAPTSNKMQSVSLSTSSLEQPTQPVSTAATHTHQEKSPQDQVILATAVVLIRDASGCFQFGRALLDSCSQVKFITEEFSRKLRLPRERHHVEIQSIGDSVTNIKYKTSAIVKSRMCDYETPLSFHVTSQIAYQPEAEFNITSWNLPANIELTDENFFKPTRVDLLIGTEIFFDILSIGQIKLAPGLPSLQKTLLGWVVSGRYQRPTENSSSICLLSVEESVDANLQRLWKLDEPSNADMWTTEQRNCEQSYLQTVQRNAEGRVVVKLPFKEAPHCLGQSYATALRRFIAQERRITRCPDLHQRYIAFMEEYSRLGHMSIVKKVDFDNPHYYVPHHYVLKPTSTTTKLSRVVFDASCKSTTQRSLNDILAVGPTLQNDLYILLLRFRLYRYTLTADIVKMYRQILVDRNDRKFQYILWRSTPHDEIRTYQLNTVTYGTASAPYLAVQSLNYIADAYESDYALGASTIKTSFYVDDLLCGADTLAELSQIKYEVTEILRRGCFPLAKWHSNHYKFREDDTMKDLNIDESFTTSTLGIQWDQIRDIFLFSFQSKQPVNARGTKRSILSIASALFDPLGLLAPVIITAKIILQEIWLLKLNWDESVPQNLQTAWERFLKDIAHLSTLSVPRYSGSTNHNSLQIHGFCDSSIRAYGCAIYLRSKSTEGKPTVTLLTAKSRVAPIKKQSLPKLELCGALLLARLLPKLNLYSTPTPTFLWTDSQIVLHWLELHSATLSTFVGNRVSEIQDLTADVSWRHVPTKCNPADIVSRGCTALELSSSIWFSGPSFLQLESENWPSNQCGQLDMEEVSREKRAKALVALLRLQFWVINARDVARRIVRSCIHCVRYKPKLFQQTMGNLPVSRLTPSRPFARCGIDFCGPIETYLRIRGKGPYKTYIAIFVCFSTKAVHIEIVSDLSTDAFLAALKRMIGRRGLPTDIYCDNATNFVGASRKLQELKMAPHFGGLWEAAVKSAKGLLNRSMANGRLTFEELNTVMISIEAILNSRPISPLSSDPNDLEALTPGHFLIGSSLKAIPEREEMGTNIDHISKWARTVAIKQSFWRRWSHEYINSLQARTKWTSGNPNVLEGLLVIIQDENAPPQRWTMGRIIKCIAGSDNRIRVVDVKTSRGILRRPVHKIAVLPA